MSKVANTATTPLDPQQAVEAIVRFNADRKPDRVRIKYLRMSADVFAFFRGTDHLFAGRWPEFRPAELGPGILICGDLHLENFGAYQTDDRDFRFDINDFDEALVAPCSFDLVRLTVSILLAADIWHMTAAAANCMALDFIAAYRAAVAAAAESGQPGEIVLGQGHGPIWELVGETALGHQAALLDHHTQIKHGQRQIIRSADKHPEIREDRARLVRAAVEKFGASTGEAAAFRVLDVTGRIMGIGSLGVRRYTVLVAGGGTSDTNRLLDVKEAVASSVLGCSDCTQPDNQGNDALRIVRAQRQLQSKPTATLAAIDIDGRPYRLREMIPEENRSKLDRLHKHPEKLRTAMTVVGQLTAWSQLRGCAAAKDRHALAEWTQGGALDAVPAAAARCADLTYRDFERFRDAYSSGRLEKAQRG